MSIERRTTIPFEIIKSPDESQISALAHLVARTERIIRDNKLEPADYIILPEGIEYREGKTIFKECFKIEPNIAMLDWGDI